MKRNLISALRQRVSVLDGVLVMLVANRIRTAGKVGEIKRTLALPVVSLSREGEVIRKLKSQLNNNKPALAKFQSFRKVWGKIIEGSRKSEFSSGISVLGPKRSYAAKASSLTAVSATSFSYRILAEMNYQVGRCERTVVPHRNSCSGLVRNNTTLLTEHDSAIEGEICIRVKHTSGTAPKVSSGVRVVGSQQYVIDQCVIWLINAAIAKASTPSTSFAKRMSGWLKNLCVLSNSRTEGDTQSYANNKTSFLMVTSRAEVCWRSNTIWFGIMKFIRQNSRFLVLFLVLAVKLLVGTANLVPFSSHLASVFLTFALEQQKDLSHLNLLCFKRSGLYFRLNRNGTSTQQENL